MNQNPFLLSRSKNDDIRSKQALLLVQKGYYSAMYLGFTQLTLLPAAIAAESSIRAKRPRLKNDKTSLQASLRSTLCFGRRRADVHRTSCAKFLSFSAAWLNSYTKRIIPSNKP